MWSAPCTFTGPSYVLHPPSPDTSCVGELEGARLLPASAKEITLPV